MGRYLAVFDFDHTIIHDNSDTVVIKLLDHIPKDVKTLHSSDGWTAFMQGVFNLLDKQKYDKTSLTNLIRNLTPTEGIIELILDLHKSNYDIIIISDANSVFINEWLKEHHLQDIILEVFTNPAHWDRNNCLNIEMYHVQDYCKLSTKNLCKGQIMNDFVAKQRANGIVYEKLIYCGDGQNDFCPILRLGKGDLACVRNKYKCYDLVRKVLKSEIKDDKGNLFDIKATIVVWDSGFDIIDKVKSNCVY